jgi:hypothetical protein
VHGKPEGFEPSSLVGRPLVQVCLGEHQMIVRFEDADLSIEGSVDLVVGGIVTRIEAGPAGAALAPLLGASIGGCAMSEEGTLTLGMSGGEALVIADDSDRYESYQLVVDGRTYIV